MTARPTASAAAALASRLAPAATFALAALAAACLLATAAHADGEGGNERLRLVPLVDQVAARLPGDLELVANVRRSPHARLPQGLVDLGNPHEPNLEILASLAADLVVTDSLMHQRHRPRLEQAGLEVFELDTRSMDSTWEGLVALAARAGNAEPVEAAVARARAQLAELRLAKPRRAMIVFATPGSPLVVTRDTWVGDLLARLGFDNVVEALADGGRGRFPGFLQVSDELLATSRPEVVLLLAHGDAAAAERAFRERLAAGPWKAVGQAVGDDVIVLPLRWFGANPGLDAPAAGQAVLTALADTDRPAVASGAGR